MLIKIIRILPGVFPIGGNIPTESRKRDEILNTDCVCWMAKDGEHWMAMPLNGPELTFDIPGYSAVDELLTWLDVWEGKEKD